MTLLSNYLLVVRKIGYKLLTLSLLPNFIPNYSLNKIYVEFMLLSKLYMLSPSYVL